MMDSGKPFQTASLRTAADYLAPDGSEIRLLPVMGGGGLCHCTLPPGKTSRPVAHHGVEEIWYVVSGEGEVWRQKPQGGETVLVRAGSSLTIPPRTPFQFRTTGDSPLCILIVTMPPWPGPEEATPAAGAWRSSIDPDKDAGGVSGKEPPD